MKPLLLAVTLLAALSLVACSTPSSAPTQTAASHTDTSSPATPTMPVQTAANSPAEEAEIRVLVESFGKRLPNVSRLAPDAAQELQKQYSEFVVEMTSTEVASGGAASRIPVRIAVQRLQERWQITEFAEEQQ
jgi:hypothetical protein